MLVCAVISCHQASNSQYEQKQPGIDYTKLLQGAWEDSKHKIYYLKDNRYSIFQSGRFYSNKYSLAHDTLWMPVLIGYSEGVVITNVSKDSLLVRPLDKKDILRLWRPSIEDLRKDTATVKRDILIAKSKRKVLGNDFEFSVLSDYDNHIFLKIELKDCKDSCVKLIHDLWFKGGDCNSNAEITSVYEVIKDNLLFYSTEDFVEHFDNTNPHSSTDYTKETYVIRKNAEIVRIKTEHGKNNIDLVKEIETKLDTLKDTSHKPQL